jgi:2TM family of unknown function (DUF5676)
MNDVAKVQSQLSIVAIGWTVSIFFVISYVLCVASGAIVPDWEMHRPWLQFFPGFEWLTLKGFVIGLVESFLYGWYVAVIFVPLYNVFTARSRGTK